MREGAKLVVIYVTDEKPDEVENGILYEGNVNPTTSQQAAIDALMQPHIDLLLVGAVLIGVLPVTFHLWRERRKIRRERRASQTTP